MTREIETRLSEDAALVERALKEYYKREDSDISVLLDAEKYSLFAGGKRIRPFLTLEFCRLFGGEDRAALPFACAVEMIHTYSLIHDDLPCMDDDDLRRGKPTNHKVYGYSTALLAGDSLLTRAFGTAASNGYVRADGTAEAVRVLAEYAGAFGMVGGQVIDLAGEKRRLPLETLLKLHSMKTGALIKASALLGALAAGAAKNSPEARSAAEYADGIGLAFQIIDDIIDATATEETAGKSVGSDTDKTTFMKYFSVDEAKRYAGELTAKAVSAVSDYENSEILTDFAAYLLDRSY
ncbi:MAG: polyprenyl synthetase family protein [Clostridia bacterium]|nr:polyprenyl synthetase family protein [Clostridia bacterium]